jgi:hypothetical protein
MQVSDDALKEQIEENTILKMTLDNKNQELLQLKEYISTNKSQQNHLKTQMEIDKIKSVVERKNV